MGGKRVVLFLFECIEITIFKNTVPIGLYNGERHHSHLAALPLPIDFAIEALPGQHIDAEWVQMRLDTGK